MTSTDPTGNLLCDITDLAKDVQSLMNRVSQLESILSQALGTDVTVIDPNDVSTDGTPWDLGDVWVTEYGTIVNPDPAYIAQILENTRKGQMAIGPHQAYGTIRTKLTSYIGESMNDVPTGPSQTPIRWTFNQEGFVRDDSVVSSVNSGKFLQVLTPGTFTILFRASFYRPFSNSTAYIFGSLGKLPNGYTDWNVGTNFDAYFVNGENNADYRLVESSCTIDLKYGDLISARIAKSYGPQVVLATAAIDILKVR